MDTTVKNFGMVGYYDVDGVIKKAFIPTDINKTKLPKYLGIDATGKFAWVDITNSPSLDIEGALANKVDKDGDKMLSTNDFTNEYKASLDGLAASLAGKVSTEAGKGLSTNDFTTAYKEYLDTVMSAQS